MSCDRIRDIAALGGKGYDSDRQRKKIGKKEKMMEKFSEMKYVRPDGEAYIRTIQKETKNFNEAAEF